MTALAPALRQLPLEKLFLDENQIGDQGLAALLAPPTAGVLASLGFLSIGRNQITDEGCAALAAALSGALPALNMLALHGNPANEQPRAAVQAVLAARRAA